MKFKLLDAGFKNLKELKGYNALDLALETGLTIQQANFVLDLPQKCLFVEPKLQKTINSGKLNLGELNLGNMYLFTCAVGINLAEICNDVFSEALVIDSIGFYPLLDNFHCSKYFRVTRPWEFVALLHTLPRILKKFRVCIIDNISFLLEQVNSNLISQLLFRIKMVAREYEVLILAINSFVYHEKEYKPLGFDSFAKIFDKSALFVYNNNKMYT